MKNMINKWVDKENINDFRKISHRFKETNKTNIY